MPRGPRLDAPGVLHHVMVRGIERRPIFWDDGDRTDFLARLAALAEAGTVVVYAWALLPNHAHLLVRTGSRPLARSMRSLLTGYAGVFNRRHKRVGHLFQNRYKSVVVEEEPYLLELVRYLHLNPLRAKRVPDLRALERYPWTGPAALCGCIPRPWQATAEVLSRFAREPRRARAAYRAFVAAGMFQGRRHELQGGGLIRSLGGWKAVQGLRRGREAYMADERILGTSAFVEGVLREVEAQSAAHLPHRRPTLDLPTLVQRVARSLGLSAEAVFGRSRVPPAPVARQLVAYLWVHEFGRPASELGRFWGQGRSHVSWAARRGAEVARAWSDEIPGWCQ
ncbi:MAG: transposase [candidate division NC10 bacterium]|nr:transposase [candidate division NC10 bacterium]